MGYAISTVGDAAGPIHRPARETRISAEPETKTSNQDSKATAEDVQASLRDNGNRISFANRTVEFSYDDELHRVIVKVYSSETDPPTVVRQIPAEEYLTFAARYRELQGILFDEQA